MKILHYYRRTETPHHLLPAAVERLSRALALGRSGDVGGSGILSAVDTEICFNVQIGGGGGHHVTTET